MRPQSIKQKGTQRTLIRNVVKTGMPVPVSKKNKELRYNKIWNQLEVDAKYPRRPYDKFTQNSISGYQ